MIPAPWSRATRWRTAASEMPSSRPILVKGRRPSRCRAATMRRSAASTPAVLGMRTTSRILCEERSFEVVYPSLDVRRRHRRIRSVISMGRRPDQERNDQLTKAYPIFYERAKVSSVWDLDGNEYSDYDIGFGVMAVGHSHPKIAQTL